MFVIEDDFHAETLKGRYETFQDALSELTRIAEIPWDEAPNVAPCQSWKTCGRRYMVIEYDDEYSPWKQLTCKSVLEVSADGVVWLDGSH